MCLGCAVQHALTLFRSHVNDDAFALVKRLLAETSEQAATLQGIDPSSSRAVLSAYEDPDGFLDDEPGRLAEQDGEQENPEEAAAEEQEEAGVEERAADRDDREARAAAEGRQHHRQHAP